MASSQDVAPPSVLQVDPVIFGASGDSRNRMIATCSAEGESKLLLATESQHAMLL